MVCPTILSALNKPKEYMLRHLIEVWNKQVSVLNFDED